LSRAVIITVTVLTLAAIHAVIYLVSLRSRMKRAEKASRETGNLWKEYVSISPAGILILSPEGHIREINPAAEKILGLQSRKSAGLPLGRVFPDVSYFENYLTNPGDPTLAGGELSYRHPGGKSRILSAKSVPLDKGTGHLISLLDITEIREYQRRRELRQKELQSIIDIIPAMIYVKDGRGTFLMANQSCADSMGYRVDEIVGTSHRDLHDYPDEVEMMLASDRKVLITGERIHIGEECITLKSGKNVYIETVKMPYVTVDTGEPAVLGISWDITDKVRLQKEIQKNESLRSLGVLAGGIAHDFNNQLMGILGYLELLGLEQQTGKGQECLEGIRSSSKKAASLVRDLLSFSREYRKQVRPFDIHRVLDDAIRTAGDPGSLSERIRCRYNSRVKEISGDPNLLQYAFQNLILNAGDAVGKTGTILVSTEDLDVEEASEITDVTVPEAGHYLVVSIEDDGAGMTEEVQSHIFEPFYSTKGEGAGSGMGLAAVYGTVKSHHGFIDVRSTPGQGSLFRVFLPADGPRTAPAAL